MHDYFGLNLNYFMILEKDPSRPNEIKDDVYNSIVIENEQVLGM